MELGEACAVYLDDRVKDERWVVRNSDSTAGGTYTGLETSAAEDDEIHTNTRLFLGIFRKVYLSNSRKSFGEQLTELNATCRPKSNPLFALVSIAVDNSSEPLEQSSQSRSMAPLTSSSTSNNKVGRFLRFSSESDDFCMLEVLARFSANLRLQTEVNLAIPVALLRFVREGVDCERSIEAKAEDHETLVENTVTGLPLVNGCVYRCLEAGACDVLVAPLTASRLETLTVQAYRIFMSAKKQQLLDTGAGRPKKHSWVGTNDHPLYSYLRETMVTKLMKQICDPGEELEKYESDLHVLPSRKRLVEAEIGKWDFSAHDFSEDELVYAGTVILEHALQMPELEPWRISSEQIRSFLLATRVTYNSFVLYHNFRHAIDVLQSTFHLLVSIGALPPYPNGTRRLSAVSPMALLLTPANALTLLITAIGHDVGHPGVNNVFLVRLNAPLAQLYNDTSVLESFHCAAYSQLLRSYWPSFVMDMKLRKLMISSILATDMGVHFKFMESLGKLREKYHETDSTDRWTDNEIETNRALLCGLLMKCADISNVARTWDIAKRWTNVLQEEFAQQGNMEKTIGMETALFGGPPELGNVPKLARSQIDFIKLFALPLFENLADLLPDMAFTTVEIRRNKSIWREIINREVQSRMSLELIQSSTTTPLAQSDSHLPSSDVKNEDFSETPLDESAVNIHRVLPAPWNLPPTLGNVQPCGTYEHSDVDKDSRGSSGGSRPLAISTTDPSGHTDPGAEDNQAPHSRRYQCHRQFQRSSGRASNGTTVNRQSDMTSGTRTQSTSTDTNNTVMTPISSTTQPSSLSSLNSSSDDEHDRVRHGFDRDAANGPSGNIRSENHRDLGTSSRASPMVVPHPANSGRPSILHTFHSDVEDGKTPHFMAAFIDKNFGHHAQGNGVTITNSNPPSNNYMSTDSAHHNFSPANHHMHDTNGINNRTVPRRRSRLRLAFWRRNREIVSAEHD
ncbi:3',5'-cyclic-nucleotide phosphodiesterase regA [Histoplasma capsulatum G186AR]|uniref:Phosphodiesterase n=2 Tax=Ajellomyces capsulatus TaxID=5037 RepID=C0NC75_AJECG|nr:3',5'-cyclic-nucleotide phosphodiesterase regA [Histoplasma capsulatum G186AR]EEH11266.1 3',5'-cyclic-nucleotide phosphodiesterase regA [Histoplasma capsulatum G186AR]KAG5302896.1 3',5'-cyclic-nucleotide phosphodiesterase regA [Histoplasma capsulatum]QSS71704.1 3',5'-cyclic-nucleotide phosphodiesterase regA [Histoplasma capsulatum G186AR]